MAVERAKLRAQWKVQGALAACAAGPFAFAAVMRVQSSTPDDTLFGRAVLESGFATPLVMLGFAGLWILPVLACLVAGDVFSSEDRYGTWPAILTRGCTRGDLFAGKALAALAFCAVSIAVLAVSSLAAGVVAVGRQPLVDLSGALRGSGDALRLVAAAWLSVLPAALGFSALAMLVSVVTRSSAAGIGLPIVAALAMQILSYIDGPEAWRRLLLTSGFVAWRGLATQPRFYGPVLHAVVTATLYLAACLVLAYGALRRRDIGR